MGKESGQENSPGTIATRKKQAFQTSEIEMRVKRQKKKKSEIKARERKG